MLRSTFLKCWDYPSIQDQKFFFSVKIFKIITFQSRLWRVKIFVKIGQDLLRRSEVCQEILRPFESENDEKSHQIEKSRHENAKIHALFNQDKLSRNAKIFRSWQISWSQSRLLVWTLMSRQNREVSISTEISPSSRLARISRLSRSAFFVSRLRVSIEITSRQIETPRLKITQSCNLTGKL